MSTPDYDLFVIGAGSGGVRAARQAAQTGARVAIAEEYRPGGTCVIRGCVPKKLMAYAADYAAAFREAPGFGWAPVAPAHNWRALIAAKDQEINRLEGIYDGLLLTSGVDMVRERAVLDGPGAVRLAGGTRITARHILLAVGATPNRHEALPGHELCLTSDELFDLPERPDRIVIAGGGYIAVEFASILRGLGAEVTLVYRGLEILSRFDCDLRRGLHAALEARGIDVVLQDVMERVERTEDGALLAVTAAGRNLAADQILLALGRRPNTRGLGLETVGIECGPTGAVPVDAYGRTTAPGVHAVGDVTDREQLTPVAIHEAMCLVDTLFRDQPRSPDHDDIATAVFTRPEIGTVGLSEEAAAEAFDAVDVYEARFRPMRATLSGSGERTFMKLVVDVATDRVLGAHVLGDGAAEMAQLLAIPIKAGLGKTAFDATMAVHPTAAEEFVTMRAPARRVGRAVGSTAAVA